MLSALFVEPNIPFLVAIGLMFAIALLEGAAMLLGSGLSHFIDAMLPDSLSGVDVDLGADIDVDAGPIDDAGGAWRCRVCSGG